MFLYLLNEKDGGINLKKYLCLLKYLTIAAIIAVVPNNAFASVPNEKVNVSSMKTWSVKFSKELKSSTVNNKNIVVTDSNGRSVNAQISPGDDSKTILINPMIQGYIPNSTYYLKITTNVQSIEGKNLKEDVTMKFKIINQALDGTENNNQPKVISCKLINQPLQNGQVPNFEIVTNMNNPEYRIFSYNVATGKYEELTKGYRKASGLKYVFKSSKAFTTGQYKLIIYSKSQNSKCKYKDSNTEYNNFYMHNFKCLDSIQRENCTYKQYSIPLSEWVNKELQGNNSVYDNRLGSWPKASKNLIEYYMNPNNFLDSNSKYMFMKLSYFDCITAEQLNSVLKGKGVFEGKGQAFLNAGKANNVNPIYLVAHALHETGNGTSKLSTGILVKSVDGKTVEPKKTYNVWGIRAYDSDPNRCGSEYAYKMGWFSVDAAIDGGAKFISSNYINSVGKQNTLYKMKWDVEPSSRGYLHQYATDINWAFAQTRYIRNILNVAGPLNLQYEIPRF